MDYITSMLKSASDMIWGGPMAISVFVISVLATVKFAFPQRQLLSAIKDSIKKDEQTNGLSAFSCLAMNLAATLGVGNIVGVAIAIELGGAGAVFWCCAAGFFAMALSYAECLITLKYREKNKDGIYIGGPMYVMEKVLKKKYLGIVYAVFACITGLSMGAMVASNSISAAMLDVNIPKHITGLVTAGLTAFVIMGGMRSVSDFCNKIVPIMVTLFVLGCVLILIINREVIVYTIVLIITSAFNIKSFAFGTMGYTIGRAFHYGISRGVFSNEAGMGSSAITAAAMKNDIPVRQALICSTAAFWDTCVLCALTGITFVSGMVKNPLLYENQHGFEIAMTAFRSIAYIGAPTLVICLLLLAFTSIIGWSYIGESAFAYLAGGRKRIIYRGMWVAAVMMGAVVPIDTVWYLSDICTAAMMLPNLYSIYKLRDICVNESKNIKLLYKNQFNKQC